MKNTIKEEKNQEKRINTITVETTNGYIQTSLSEYTPEISFSFCRRTNGITELESSPLLSEQELLSLHDLIDFVIKEKKLNGNI
jgi:hypothetical protein